MKLLLSFIVVSILCSCGQSNYSPLDTYINTTIEVDSLNNVSNINAQHYIDSINASTK